MNNKIEVSFSIIDSKEQLETLAILTDEIWHEYFPCILSEEQIDYMVKKFQSLQAIKKQIADDGYTYFFVSYDDDNIGYIGLKPDDEKLFLSKLYLKKDFRGKGIASTMLEKVFNEAKKLKKNAVYLTVNRFNEHSIDVYTAKGFQIIRSQKTDIGEGFVMDDYVMEKLF